MRASTVSLLSPSLEEKEKVSVRETMGDRGKRGKEASVEERVIAVLFLCNLFYNIAVKRVEQRCCAFYHPHQTCLVIQHVNRFERG